MSVISASWARSTPARLIASSSERNLPLQEESARTGGRGRHTRGRLDPGPQVDRADEPRAFATGLEADKLATLDRTDEVERLGRTIPAASPAVR